VSHRLNNAILEKHALPRQCDFKNFRAAIACGL
jgi:hypothetical protein